MSDNPISDAVQAYQRVVPSPLLQSLLLGGSIFGLGRLGWNRGVETARSLFRLPATKMTGMTNREYDDEVDNIKSDSGLQVAIPGMLGLGALASSLALTHRSGEEGLGQLAWNSRPNGYVPNRDFQMPTGMGKGAAMQKFASSLFEYGGYVPSVDVSQIINVPYTKEQFFSNDPFLQNKPYVKSMGISILADAQNREGSSNVSLGSIQDSASDKFKSKFSFDGIGNIAMRSMLANTAASMFTTALGAVTGLSKDNQRRIIDAGTWAGAISSIIT